MKISCPNCQKNYRVNSAAIPAGVETVKCKACGHPMPLKGRAPGDKPVKKDGAATGPSLEIPVIKRSCLYCGQSHDLRQDKIPQGTTAIKCKFCGRPVPLKLEETVGNSLVHSLKKEASEADSANHPQKAPPQPSRAPEVLILTCQRCQKRYKIQSHKIPPTAKSLKCRACGHRLKLPVPEAAAKPPITAPPSLPPITRSPQGKVRPYALAVGLLLLVLAGVYAGLTMFKDRRLEPLPSGNQKQSAAATAFLKQEPFLALNLNMPLIIKNIDQRIAKGKKTHKFRTTISLIKSLRLKRLEVFLYAGHQKQILPVVLARGTQARHLEKIATRPEAFADYFERQSAGIYRLKPEAFEKTTAYGFPNEPYQMILVDKGAVFAPASVAGALASDQSWLQKTAAAKFAASIADPQDLVRVAIRISEDMPTGWEKKIQPNPAWTTNPQVARIAGIGNAILTQLTDALETVETLTLGFRFRDKDGRSLSYAQQFRPNVDGNAVYQQLNSGNLQDVAADGVVKELLELFQNRRYKHIFEFADNRLDAEFSWHKKDDRVLLSALSKAAIGQMFAKSKALTPTPGPVTAEYTDDPQLFTTVDGQALKPRIPRIVKQSLSRGSYRNSLKNPQMTLELNPVNIPNAVLAKLSYEVRSIKSKDGRNILRSDNNQPKHPVNPGSALPSKLILDVQNGTPPASLGKARIQFRLALPDTLQVFNFKKGEDQDYRKEAGGIQVTLDRLEKDVAVVTASGGKSLHLIAYDKTGKALASRVSISSVSSVATRFQGVIDRLKVVVAVNVLEFPFEIEVDLNGGRIRKASLDGKPGKEN